MSVNLKLFQKKVVHQFVDRINNNNKSKFCDIFDSTTNCKSKFRVKDYRKVCKKNVYWINKRFTKKTNKSNSINCDTLIRRMIEKVLDFGEKKRETNL